MSMLAEKKVKQKWSLNPRGKAWSEDSNKFGQKILEKMGWSKGKGLGAKEDGITDHLKVSYKNDAKGMGYKESDGQWREHDSNFNALLTALSEHTSLPLNDKNEHESLETKSQNSKVRVHYHKFTRGKDLSRYTDKDLADIFGQRSTNDAPTEQIKYETKFDLNNSFIVNSGSMTDYFKKKLSKLMKTNNGQNDISDQNDKNLSVCNDDNDGRFQNENQTNNNDDDSNVLKKKKKKKRKSNSELEEIQTKKIKIDDGGLMNPGFDPFYNNIQIEKHILDTINEENDKSIIEDRIHVIQSKKKKKATESNDCPDQNNVFSLEPIDEEAVLKRKTKNKRNNDLNESIHNHCDDVEIKSMEFINSNLKTTEKPIETGEIIILTKNKNKKKKINNETHLAIDNPNFIDNDCEIIEYNKQIDNNEVKTKKRKSKKIDECRGIDNASFNDLNDNAIQRTDNSEIKARNKKTKKTNECGIDNLSFIDTIELNDSYSNQEIDNSDVNVKKQKKIDQCGIDNLTFNENNQQTDNSEIKAAKKKKSRKADKCGIENPSFNGKIELIDNNSQEVDNFEVKAKKKTKKIDECGIDNPSFNDNIEFNNNNDSKKIDNSVIKAKKKKKTKTVECGVDNPTFNDKIDCELSEINDQQNDNYEIKITKKKKTEKTYECGIDNPSFYDKHENNDNSEMNAKNKKKSKRTDDNPNVEKNCKINDENSNLQEIDNTKVKTKQKKSKKSMEFAIDNPSFNGNDNASQISNCENYEVKRKSKKIKETSGNDDENEQKKKKKKSNDKVLPLQLNDNKKMNNGIDNPSLNLDDPIDGNVILNVTTVTTTTRENNGELKQRKWRRFNNNNNNNNGQQMNDLANRNELYDINTKVIENGMRKMNNNNSFARRLNNVEAEIENEMNHARIGEIGDPDGENEKLPNGTRLKFKYAQFGATQRWDNAKGMDAAKKSYKHLIKGDIIVQFNNTNLHAIEGYAVKKKQLKSKRN